MRHKVIAVDCDGTLTTGTAWTVEEVLAAEPRQDVIDAVNKAAEEGIIVIWTARRDHLLPATQAWLRKHGVTYHAISNFKMPADIYIDDRAASPEAFSGFYNEGNGDDAGGVVPDQGQRESDIVPVWDGAGWKCPGQNRLSIVQGGAYVPALEPASDNRPS